MFYLKSSILELQEWKYNIKLKSRQLFDLIFEMI